MLQAIGLTSAPRRDLPPAVDDLTFEARPGQLTALLGVPGSGRTTALRLMLELEPGRGVTYFRGRPLHQLAHPAREVGTLLGDVPGHPARTVRGQLKLMCTVAGVPVSRAEEMLDVVGLRGLADQRLGTLSLGMDRRLGLAAALLGDPHTLLLDEPAEGLSPRENAWLHGLLRGHADHGGTVLCTFADPKEAARLADRVVTIDGGRLVADQDATEFARTRLRPRVAVATPHAARLGALVSREARAAHRSVEVVAEDGNHLSVYGSSCAEVGETAFRNGVLLHQLADEIGETGPSVTVPPRERTGPPPGSHSPPLARHPARTPLRPLRYELRRFLGVRTTFLLAAGVLALSAVLAVLLARSGHTPQPRLLAAWPGLLPLPPAALGAGLFGALAFGDEYRYPALAADRGTVPRRLGLLAAKLLVTAAAALVLAALAVAVDHEALRLVYGAGVTGRPQEWLGLGAGWAGLTVGCAWAGLLAAGIFRATTAGLAAVLAVPVVVVPLLKKAVDGRSVRSVAGLPDRLRDLAWVRWPHALDHWLIAALHLVAEPVGAALALSLTVLICAYLFTGLRARARW
ncbi:ATP-binding cassette domain-containing protein [Streptomyces sp. ASQP_92]|uniref:ATP-binding cassette domain-containing protein n=1 Tax=Streptomyces sp. ASQP_92 TaxID=2979116 RepID=UPI0021BFC2CE|nr:ATP-binding cassette domain-containing protein [Streptomyces sp. ASQP_92]MCT9090799.1 ATP-binding cassette domain-containing protein [Streptomyces sp. ASQP_92]